MRTASSCAMVLRSPGLDEADGGVCVAPWLWPIAFPADFSGAALPAFADSAAMLLPPTGALRHGGLEAKCIEVRVVRHT
jgi:hypothetical protein